jgi:ATP-dependent helicase HrpB
MNDLNDYPVLNVLDELKRRLVNERVVILQAPPGAGKSTVLPLKLKDETWLGSKKIIMLEPRRLAARSVALRMSALLNEQIGKSIGYRVRFESRVSEQTQIEVVTEGILTRMIQTDNSLDDVGLIIFDEFHERSLNADLALALSLQVSSVLRDDLRILIMSATLDIESITAALKTSVITSSGRQYPIAIEYLPEDDQRIYINVSKAIKRALVKESGDILAFLPGAGEISRTTEIIETEFPEVSVHPLFGDLSFQKQQEAIMPHPNGRRKVVLATSIAETSLTIEGIKVVVDSGYSRIPRFDPRSGFTRLETVRVTKDVADQRAGRAGRLGPGICYRLWSSNVQATLKSSRTPEIMEADLAPMMLELSEWGVKDIRDLDWISIPPGGAVNHARQLLHDLEALHNNQITERGKRMVRLPTHPRIAHLLVEGISDSSDRSLIAIATDIAALLEERDPLEKQAGADLTLRLDALRKWRKGERVMADRMSLERIEKLAASWRKNFRIDVDNTPVLEAHVGRMIMEAFPERVARQTEKHSERYKLMNGRIARLPPNDPLTREQWIAIAQLDAGSGEGKIFLAAPLDDRDLLRHAVEEVRVFWDEGREMIAGVSEKKIGGLVLTSRAVTTIREENRVSVWCDLIRQKGLRILGWEEKLSSWQNRVLSLKKWRPDESWPDVSEPALLETLENWLAPFLGSVSKLNELQKLQADNILSSILPWDLQSRLNVLAPEKLSVPSGSQIHLHYSGEGNPPVMEVRLQEVFGLSETPTVNEGRNKIMLHLLSPGYKPVQVTQDLKSFWTNTYAEVRKELRMRYPRHSWPEDPWTAEAVRGAKRRT